MSKKQKPSTADEKMSKIIIFVHGAWFKPASWKSFRQFFAEQGFFTDAFFTPETERAAA